MPAPRTAAKPAAARVLPDWYLRSRLEIRQILLLVALDEHRNMHRAATAVAMTQPAATDLVQALREVAREARHDR